MLQDSKLPSVTTIVAGEPVKGSWWGHARSHAMFNTAEALEEHPDVAVAKLINEKVTYVHRRLWPALRAVGAAREEWQTRGLTPQGQALLRAVEKAGSLRTDLAAAISKKPPREIARAASELERRLLVSAREVHTQSGAHAKELKAWRRWARGAGLQKSSVDPAQGRLTIERALRAMNERAHSKAKLPWETPFRPRP